MKADLALWVLCTSFKCSWVWTLLEDYTQYCNLCINLLPNVVLVHFYSVRRENKLMTSVHRGLYMFCMQPSVELFIAHSEDAIHASSIQDGLEMTPITSTDVEVGRAWYFLSQPTFLRIILVFCNGIWMGKEGRLCHAFKWEVSYFHFFMTSDFYAVGMLWQEHCKAQ